MSNRRSRAGTSLAPETSAQPILSFQEFAPSFLESATRRQFLAGSISLSAVQNVSASSTLLGAAASAPVTEPIFSPRAKWIWDSSDRWSYHHYVEAEREFAIGEAELARLRQGGHALLAITADAYYQASLNGRVLGQGPAKSADHRRSVDRWDILGSLIAGQNRLSITALGLGTGTMAYCPGEAGLVFELILQQRSIVSDSQTRIRPHPARQKRTARRWVMPCIDDVDATHAGIPWQSATVVPKTIELYHRRVALPSREELRPARLVDACMVRLPNVAITMRLRPYLTDGEERLLDNHFSTPAFVLTDIASPIDQTLDLKPTLGNITWYFRGERISEGSGWSREPTGRIALRKGRNRLIGVHNRRNHFEDINLAGYAPQPVQFVNPFGGGAFQVVRADSAKGIKTGGALESLDWEALRPKFSKMDPADSMPFGNCADLAFNAEPLDSGGWLAAVAIHRPGLLELPPAPAGRASRVIVDLGSIQNGWIAFDGVGSAGSRLILGMFEALESEAPLKILWPKGCNNAVAYTLRRGSQSFETFFAYGVRYLAIHHSGKDPVRLENLRVLTANCGSVRNGSLRSSDGELNSIYSICQQTTISGVDDTFTDCPTFEAVNWNFDNRAAYLGEVWTCGNAAVARNSIELFAEDPRFKGLVNSQYPSTWLASPIPLWSLHWIMWCWDYFWFTGDRAFLERIMPRVIAGIEEVLSRLGPRKLLEWPGAWHFIEWNQGRDDNHALMSAEQAGLAGALEAAVRIVRFVDGDASARARRWSVAREELIAAINSTLWDEARGAYIDSLHEDGKPSAVSSKATNAAMIVYGVASPERTRLLAVRIAANDSPLLSYGSPYGLFYMLEALDKVGDKETIFGYIRRVWGEMLAAGDGTTWEEAGPLPRSRCHPYSAYVTKYLVKYLLGIEVSKPGFREFSVHPNPPRAITRCSGAVPTPAGLIRVEWRLGDGGMNLHVDHPAELVRA